MLDYKNSFNITLDIVSIPLAYKFSQLTYKGYELYFTPANLSNILSSASNILSSVLIKTNQGMNIRLKESGKTIIKSEDF